MGKLVHCLLFCLLLVACRDENQVQGDELTVGDVLKVQDLTPFLIRMPSDFGESDSFRLEVFSESGVVDSATFSGTAKAGEVVKVFLHKDSSDYRFSVVTDLEAMSDVRLELGDARLRVWRGNSDRKVFNPGDALAGFDIDGEISYKSPKGDDVSLRVSLSE